MDRLVGRFPRLTRLWADADYRGSPVVESYLRRWRLTTVEKTGKGWERLTKRWLGPGSAPAQRTFAWLGRWRRLSKDCEALEASSEAWIKRAMVAASTTTPSTSTPSKDPNRHNPVCADNAC